MSRTFAGTEWFRFDGAVLTAAPVSMACWFRKNTSAAGTYALVGLYNSASNGNGNQFRLAFVNQTAANNPTVTALTGEALTSSSSAFAPDGGVSETYNGKWVHAAAVFASVSSRIAYFNGAPGAEQTTTRTPVGINRTSLGRIDNNAPSGATIGSVAEAAIWNTALSTTEVRLLASGVSPLLVRPNSLLAYWPLFGADAPESDRSLYGDRFVMSPNGDTRVSDTPPLVIQYQFANRLRELSQRDFGVTAAAGGAPTFNAAWCINTNKVQSIGRGF